MMVGPRQEKTHVKNSIMEILDKKGEGLRSVMTASFCLETGFSEKVIEKIFSDLVTAGFITIVDDRVALVQKPVNSEEEQ